MKASFTITLVEMVELLRLALLDRTGLETEDIIVTSYDMPRIVIHSDGLVECTEFKHRAD